MADPEASENEQDETVGEQCVQATASVARDEGRDGRTAKRVTTERLVVFDSRKDREPPRDASRRKECRRRGNEMEPRPRGIATYEHDDESKSDQARSERSLGAPQP